MADSLSRSEIESLLAATKADSALLPQPTNRIDEHVNFDSFDQDASSEDFFAKLAQDTVDSLNVSTELNLTVTQVRVGATQDADSRIEPADGQRDEPMWRIDMVDTKGDPWSVLFDSDFVFPLIASILGSPVEDNRPVPQLSFIEERLVRPVFARIFDHLNADLAPNGDSRSLQLAGDTKPTTQGANTVMRSAECRVEGSAFASTIVFNVPASACFRVPGVDISLQTSDTTVQIEASLTATTISSDDIGHLEIGDILMTDIDPESLLIASVDDVPAFRGTMGIFQGRKALLIAEKVAEIR